MPRKPWHPPFTSTQRGRNATRTEVIELIDRTVPETKRELASVAGISDQYLSELLRDLKGDGIVKKAYVVDDAELYANTDGSMLRRTDESGSTPSQRDRGARVMHLLQRLETATSDQYAAAKATFHGEVPEQSACSLESLTNARHAAVMTELKSYTLTTDWPGNRVAADLAIIATNLEIIGDRACFISDVIADRTDLIAGEVGARLDDVFVAGERINDLFTRILFDREFTAKEALRSEEEQVHRDLDELFELVTAYDTTVYACLVTVTRALERTLFYWADAAEIAIRLYTGLDPGHIEF